MQLVIFTYDTMNDKKTFPNLKTNYRAIFFEKLNKVSNENKFMKIWMMKLNRKYVKQLRKDWKQFLKNLDDEAKDIFCRRDQK